MLFEIEDRITGNVLFLHKRTRGEANYSARNHSALKGPEVEGVLTRKSDNFKSGHDTGG